MASPNVPSVAFNKLTLNKNGEVSPIPTPMSIRTRNNLLPTSGINFNPLTIDDLRNANPHNGQVRDLAQDLGVDTLNPVVALNNLFTENSVDIVAGLVGLALVTISLYQIVKPV